MKKSSRLLSLALALVLALSLMALPAAAAHEHDDGCATCSAEEIQPRGPVMTCPDCGKTATLQTDKITGKQFFKCPYCRWSDDPAENGK